MAIYLKLTVKCCASASCVCESRLGVVEHCRDCQFVTAEICVQSLERMHSKMMSLWFMPLVLVLFPMQWVRGVVAVNVLVGTDPGLAVNPNQYLTSPNGQYALVMQPDCNLVGYHNDQAFVGTTFSNYAPTPDCSFWMQGDGNFVIYNFTGVSRTLTVNNSLWALEAFVGSNRSFLLLRDDGSSAFYDSDNLTPWTNLFNKMQERFRDFSAQFYSDFHSNTKYTAWKPSNNSLSDFSYMPAGYFLSAGEKLQITNRSFTLELGTDCNLQSKSGLGDGQVSSHTLWESNSTRTNNTVCQLTLQPNGSLQILDVNSRAIWSSPASGASGANWILKGNQIDGVWSISDITNSSNVIWNTAPAPASHSGKSSIPLIAGVLGSVAGVLVLAFTVLGMYFYTRERFLDPSEKAFQAQLKAKGGTSYAFPRAKIKQATKNYENVIGRGGFGAVYKGKLPDGREVAAKVLSANSRQSKQEFFNEIELLSTVHHKNLVSLVGFSCTRKHQVLIYEFMGGGDLHHRLQGESSAENPLSWRQRTNIILQVAEGLEYLHDKCSPPIIHRDVKSTNILLTDQLMAKVADFGLSKLKTIGQENATHVTTSVKGTPGYLDPEYYKTGLLTEKSDVYAFGVVLMDILTGRPHVDIAQKVREAWRGEQVDGLADPNLGDDFDKDKLVSLVELALWCARKRSAERPFMNQVVRRLNDLGLGGTSETVHDGIDLGEEYERHSIDIEVVATGLEDLDSETQRIFIQQYAR